MSDDYMGGDWREWESSSAKDRAELTRLRSELEEAKSEQKRWEHLAQKCWDERDAEFNRRLPETLMQIEREAALRSDLEKAKEALKPFADEFQENWQGYHDYTDDDDMSLDDMSGTSLTAAHLRTAARILSELENSKTPIDAGADL